MALWISSALYGFKIYSHTCRRIPFCAASKSSYELMSTNSQFSPSLLDISMRSNPERPGIRISVNTTSGSFSRRNSKASSGSVNWPIMEKPSLLQSMISARPCSAHGSSSMITTVYISVHPFLSSANHPVSKYDKTSRGLPPDVLSFSPIYRDPHMSIRRDSVSHGPCH